MRYHGLFLIHKKEGETSHDVVNQMRRLLGTKEVGHAGTLDPLATGLMILLIGEGTKLSQYLLEKDKTYRLSARLGYETDSLDRTGKILTEARALAETLALEPDKIHQQVLALNGELNLPIPMYSAKKVDGKKLYEYARENREIEQPFKMMKFWDLKIHQISGVDIDLSLTCSKGSFIRSWVSELGKRLGCGATLEALVREGSTPYRLENSASIQQFAQWIKDQPSGSDPSAMEVPFFIPLTSMLQGVKRLRVEGKDEKMIQDGLIGHQLRSSLISRFQPGSDEIVQIFSKDEEKLLALIGLDPEKGFRIRRVFSTERMI